MTSMPSYTGGSEPYGESAPALATPADVLMSVRLWFASIAIGVIGGILNYALTDQDKAIQTILDGGTNISRADAQTAVTIGLVIGLVFALIILGLEVLFVLKMKVGRNWARIVLTVLGAISVVSSLFGLTRGFELGTVFSLLSAIAVVAAGVYMFRPAAAPYFASRPR